MLNTWLAGGLLVTRERHLCPLWHHKRLWVLTLAFWKVVQTKTWKTVFGGFWLETQQTLFVLILHNTGPSKRKDAAETQENVFRYWMVRVEQEASSSSVKPTTNTPTKLTRRPNKKQKQSVVWLGRSWILLTPAGVGGFSFYVFQGQFSQICIWCLKSAVWSCATEPKCIINGQDIVCHVG